MHFVAEFIVLGKLLMFLALTAQDRRAGLVNQSGRILTTMPLSCEDKSCSVNFRREMIRRRRRRMIKVERLKLAISYKRQDRNMFNTKSLAGCSIN